MKLGQLVLWQSFAYIVDDLFIRDWKNCIVCHHMIVDNSVNVLLLVRVIYKLITISGKSRHPNFILFKTKM